MAETPTPPPPPVLEAAPALWQTAGGRHWIAVQGRSMWPLLRPGDSVLVQHGGRAPRSGDVLIVRQAGALLVHRLLALTLNDGQPQYWTQGDAQSQPDAPHRPAASLGRVIARRRGSHETALTAGLTARLVARLQWGARGRSRLGRKLRRGAVRALTALRWRW